MASTGARTSDLCQHPLKTLKLSHFRRSRRSGTLSNGRQINLADWKVVLFMQGHCPYCHQFDPVLKSPSARVGFGVMAYTIDGQGDASFPDALRAAGGDENLFPNLPVATPTTFLVNVNALEARCCRREQGFLWPAWIRSFRCVEWVTMADQNNAEEHDMMTSGMLQESYDAEG